ncbi:MAG: type II toxin-antitoxin system RelE/ParE family toxin [Pyrinomonadaceae bacterium]|nr:type II toxin-antitoxin system RelE/ParE family toxin [Pyrinomonadaceae bacterium]
MSLTRRLGITQQKAGWLGVRFSDVVKKTVLGIAQYPEAWPSITETTRHCQVKGFPYGVTYYLRVDELVIVAVMHNSREPYNWKDRLPAI